MQQNPLNILHQEGSSLDLPVSETSVNPSTYFISQLKVNLDAFLISLSF